jgi:hypothetical protein
MCHNCRAASDNFHKAPGIEADLREGKEFSRCATIAGPPVFNSNKKNMRLSYLSSVGVKCL